MTALVQVISRLSAAETLKKLAMLGGAGLFVPLVCAAYGLDLGAEFF
jgi:hypothetical protein